MTQKEFNELSVKEVKNLNGSESEEAQEAWRAGYIYAQRFVRQSFENDYNDEFINKMDEFSNEELDEFNL